jgi:hypothetical protein
MRCFVLDSKIIEMGMHRKLAIRPVTGAHINNALPKTRCERKNAKLSKEIMYVPMTSENPTLNMILPRSGAHLEDTPAEIAERTARGSE